jgi:ribonuclease E
MATRPTAAKPIKALTPCAVAAELPEGAGAEAEVLEEADEAALVPVLEAVAPVLEAAPPVLVTERLVLEVALAAPVVDAVSLVVEAAPLVEAAPEILNVTP